MIVSYNSQIKKLSFKQEILFSILETTSIIESNKFKNNKTVKKISKKLLSNKLKMKKEEDDLTIINEKEKIILIKFKILSNTGI